MKKVQSEFFTTSNRDNYWETGGGNACLVVLLTWDFSGNILAVKKSNKKMKGEKNKKMVITLNQN